MLRIGIDLGGTKTEGVVIDEAGAELRRERRATPANNGYRAILANAVALVRHLENAAGATCRVGIGTPGALSVQTGRLKNSNTTCLNGHPIRDDLEQLLGRPVRIANDANCFALSEARDGAGRGAEVVFGVILGTGVGGGIVVGGRLWQGAQYLAGEWGHNVLDRDGPPCYCGKRGCVETFLSGPGLVRDYAGGQAGASSATDVVALAASGDARAGAALERYLERFSEALSVVINILDPDVIVLGGGMSNLDALYDTGFERLARRVFAAHGPTDATASVSPRMGESEPLRTRLCRNVHGDSSGVRGAAFLWEADEP